MLASSRVAATRATAAMALRRPAAQTQQRRGFIDYLVKYPDTVMEKKKIQMAGGTCQGEKNPTWLKQPGDAAVAWFGAGVTAFGMVQILWGIYHLATGKGKMD